MSCKFSEDKEVRINIEKLSEYTGGLTVDNVKTLIMEDNDICETKALEMAKMYVHVTKTILGVQCTNNIPNENNKEIN